MIRNILQQYKNESPFNRDLGDRCERKKVEMLFAHLKRLLKLDRLRLRGLTGAHDEFLLAATAQNLRRMAKRLGSRRQITGSVCLLKAKPPHQSPRQSTLAARWWPSEPRYPDRSAPHPTKKQPRAEFFNSIGQMQTFIV